MINMHLHQKSTQHPYTRMRTIGNWNFEVEKNCLFEATDKVASVTTYEEEKINMRVNAKQMREIERKRVERQTQWKLPSEFMNMCPEAKCNEKNTFKLILNVAVQCLSVNRGEKKNETIFMKLFRIAYTIESEMTATNGQTFIISFASALWNWFDFVSFCLLAGVALFALSLSLLFPLFSASLCSRCCFLVFVRSMYLSRLSSSPFSAFGITFFVKSISFSAVLSFFRLSYASRCVPSVFFSSYRCFWIDGHDRRHKMLLLFSFCVVKVSAPAQIQFLNGFGWFFFIWIKCAIRIHRNDIFFIIFFNVSICSKWNITIEINLNRLAFVRCRVVEICAISFVLRVRVNFVLISVRIGRLKGDILLGSVQSKKKSLWLLHKWGYRFLNIWKKIIDGLVIAIEIWVSFFT